MIQHRHALARQVGGQVLAVVDAGHEGGQVIGIGLGHRQVPIGGFEAVGGAEHVDLTAAQGLERFGTGWIALDLHLDVQELPEQLRIVGGQAFIVATIAGDAERRVVRRRGAQLQRALLAQPGPVGIVQGHRIIAHIGAPEHLQRLGGRAHRWHHTQ
nr:hypothetical protein GCM10020185_60590 [Pseudomonas brassicacearum subsp. brassicacearum]